ncbi:MAG: GTP 3',8-cyclase MoaA [Myxococcota bacterium]
MSSLRILTTQPADDVVCGTGVTDGRGRRVRYLRMSVTDRCDMACVYCMPTGYQGSPRDEVLTFEEMVRVVRAFHANGVRTVRLTGGEPLLRKSLVELCRALTTEIPELDLALTTNGSLLSRFAVPLRQAGLRRINISVDSLDPARFAAITRGGSLPTVLDGIKAAQDAGFTELKTNTVVLRHENLDEVRAITEWARDHGLTPRFIELMPLGEGAAIMDQLVPWEETRARLGDLVDEATPERPHDRGPAFYLPLKGGGRVGFITAVSNAFCDVCDRVRLTAKGEIRACLASPDGVSLRDILRSGATDEQLTQMLELALAGKTQHAFTEQGHGQAPQVIMTGVGG